MTDHDVRDRLRAAADPLRVELDDALVAFHRARPRRDRIRRAATITTALGLAAIAFGAVWLSTPFGGSDVVPGATSGVTGPVVVAPTGTIAYMVVTRNGEFSSLATADLDTGARTVLALPAPFTAYPVFSPDGSRIAYASGAGYSDMRVAVAAADGSDGHDISAEELAGPGLGWSPDGSMLAYVGAENTDSAANAVRVVNVDGTNDHAVVAGLEWQSVSWSPDGTKLLVVGHPLTDDNIMGPGGWDIYVASVDGSDLRPLTSTQAWEHAASWSPDGSQILFTRSNDFDDADYDQDIWVMDADGSNERRLTDWKGFDASPAWSPDGNRIVFASDRDATPDQRAAFRRTDAAEGISLFVMRPDGSDVQRVVTAGQGEGLIPGSWRASG